MTRQIERNAKASSARSFSSCGTGANNQIMRGISICIALICLLAAHPLSSARKNDENEQFKKATSYFFQKKFEIAESLLRQIVVADPENALAYSYLGDICLIKKRYDEALGYYRKSVELKPDAGENYFRLGQIYYYKKDGETAVDNFRQAIETDSRLKFAYYHIGLTYLMLLRDKKNTIENWEAYIKIATDDPQYDKIKRAIELLKDPKFIIPPPGSDTTIEEALMLGGLNIEKTMHKSKNQEAGHELKKTKQELEDIYLDEDM